MSMSDLELEYRIRHELKQQSIQYVIKKRTDRIRIILASGDYTEPMIELYRTLFESNLSDYRAKYGQKELDKLVASLKVAPQKRDLFT
jgi:hypothetical protein